MLRETLSALEAGRGGVSPFARWRAARGEGSQQTRHGLVAALLVVASVSVSIALGFVLTKFLLSVMLAVIPALSGVRLGKPE